MKKILIILGILIHLSFYVSALKTHTYDYFFPWGNIHEWQGMDFYQIPKGAYAYLRGGKLDGKLPDGVPNYSFGNSNVYHPFLTLLIGVPLQLIPAQFSLKLWILLHAVVTFSIAGFIIYKFRGNKHLPFAIFIGLALFPHYLEIWNGQYQFLLDTALFFFLLYQSSIAYACSLLVKPIGILWIPALLIQRKFRTLLIGIGLFIAVTLPFILNGDAKYFINNLLDRIQNPIGGPPGIFTLDSLLRFWHIPFYNSMLAKTLIALSLIFIEIRLKLNFFKSIFLWIVYYLLFYDLVFEYHYTTLFPLLTIGILTQKAFQTRTAKLLSLLSILPTPFFLMHYFQLGANKHEVTNLGWSVLVLFRIVPLMLLIAYILYHTWSANKILLNKKLEKN